MRKIDPATGGARYTVTLGPELQKLFALVQAKVLETTGIRATQATVVRNALISLARELHVDPTAIAAAEQVTD